MVNRNFASLPLFLTPDTPSAGDILQGRRKSKRRPLFGNEQEPSERAWRRPRRSPAGRAAQHNPGSHTAGRERRAGLLRLLRRPGLITMRILTGY